MLHLIKVTGHSLTPEYQEGDFVLVSKIPFLLSSPRSGDTIVFHHPAYGTMIKQVESIDQNTGALLVTGTHAESIDSRQFGSISQKQIIGKVIFHIRKEA